jgi:glutamate 5-kinase
MTVMLGNDVIPIVNENDTISVTELMFTDNDELSGLVATMMDAEALIILSNIDGIYNGNPSDPACQVIRRVESGKRSALTDYIQTSRSGFGRGGMQTKYHVARKVADEGITVIIANGKREDILPKVLRSGSDTVSTRFIPSEKPISGVKKWIAHSDGFEKGQLHINTGAYEALTGPKATSLLPVGVTEVKGDFEKDDIVGIYYNGLQIGVGKSAFDSQKIAALMGVKGGKPVVHYDYLYLFES